MVIFEIMVVLAILESLALLAILAILAILVILAVMAILAVLAILATLALLADLVDKFNNLVSLSIVCSSDNLATVAKSIPTVFVLATLNLGSILEAILATLQYWQSWKICSLGNFCNI